MNQRTSSGSGIQLRVKGLSLGFLVHSIPPKPLEGFFMKLVKYLPHQDDVQNPLTIQAEPINHPHDLKVNVIAEGVQYVFVYKQPSFVLTLG